MRWICMIMPLAIITPSWADEAKQSMHLIEFGADVCPDVESLEAWGSEILKGNVSAEPPPPCFWLDAGEVVYGPPLARKVHSQHSTWEFLKMKLADDRAVWIEAANLK